MKPDVACDANTPPASKNGAGWASPVRWLLLAGLVLAVVLFFALGLQRYVRLDAVKEQRDQLRAWVESNYLTCLAVFFAVYLAVSALSIPVGAPVLSLLAGFLFDRWVGTLAVSFASTAGATLAFLASRYLFRGIVERRFGAWLAPIDRGLERDGPYYLLTLRLVPVVPFTATNLVMGLTRMPARTFWWVSQLGMLPATFLYVNAGKQLLDVQSIQDVLSPATLLSLALLGVAPLAFRLLVRWWRGGKAAS